MSFDKATRIAILMSLLCHVLTACSSESYDYSPTASTAGEQAFGWPTYSGQPSGTQYSALDQVNLGNLDQLEMVWTQAICPMAAKKRTAPHIRSLLYTTMTACISARPLIMS